jgi:hypothetical protein
VIVVEPSRKSVSDDLAGGVVGNFSRKVVFYTFQATVRQLGGPLTNRGGRVP